MKKLLLLLFIPLLFSCEKEPVVKYEKADVIVINVNDVTQYTYYDLTQDYNWSKKVKNGEGHYRFTVKHYDGKQFINVFTDREIIALIPSINGDIQEFDDGFKQTVIVEEEELVKYKIHYE